MHNIPVKSKTSELLLVPTGILKKIGLTAHI
jgi:hypothetical protein